MSAYGDTMWEIWWVLLDEWLEDHEIDVRAWGWVAEDMANNLAAAHRPHGT